MNNINFSSSTAEVECEENFPYIPVPCRVGVYGPSQCGKSTFIYNLLKFRESVFSDTFDHIIYCMPENTHGSRTAYVTALREICPNIYVHEGLPDTATSSFSVNNPTEKKLFIYDDLAHSLLTTRASIELMIQNSHHLNISVIYTSQNYFQKSEDGKTFQRQLTVKIIFEDRSDSTVLTNISRVVFRSTTYLHRCLEILKETFPEDNHPYLLIGKYIYIYIYTILNNIYTTTFIIRTL